MKRAAEPCLEPLWDGVARSYVPPRELTIASRTALHRADNQPVDPVTYEVVRNALVNINLEHGALLRQLCISPVVIFSRDYQTALLAEDGGLVVMGPNLQYFANCASVIVQWILENRSANPGIAPGDIWFSNDPYVGSPHQPDACLAAPVFADGALFGWVTSLIHYGDVGGARPGGQNQAATDIWQEAPCFPPVKIAEGGVVRDDVRGMFLRQSRRPAQVGADLSAALATAGRTRDKVEGLIARYGAAVVKQVMRGWMNSGERLMRDRLAPLPDGSWQHRVYTEAAVPGDRGIYCMQVNLTKTGDRLVIDNLGTDPQAGAINISFGAFSGAALSALTSHLVPDLAGAFGGAYRLVDFALTPGLLNAPDHPAAVSPTGAITAQMALYAAYAVASKMMMSATDPAVRARALGPTIPHFFANSIWLGMDDGTMKVFGNPDGMLGGIGPQPERDGIAAGGHAWIPECFAPNVEENEQEVPLLYLYRRHLRGGGDGAGRMRGALGFEEALMVHGARSGQSNFYMNESFPKAQGPWGGNPGSRGYYVLRHGARATELLGGGQVPQSLDALHGQSSRLLFKGPLPEPLAAGDVLAWSSPSTAGWGDPLLRDPEAVRADHGEGVIDREAAARVYGVAIDAEGRVDNEATTALRAEARRERLGHPPSRLPDGAGEPGRAVGDMLALTDSHWACRCGATLGPAEDNYKLGTVQRRTPVAAVVPEFRSDDPEMADGMELREFLCPDCGTRLDTELARVGDPILHDLRLA